MRPRRPTLTYANVMSTIAVFGVLAGGGAYAASKIGPKEIAKNAVRAKHIKKKQVRAKHIKPGHVRSKHIRDGSLTGEDIADDSLTGADIRDSSIALGELGANSVNSAKIVDGQVAPPTWPTSGSPALSSPTTPSTRPRSSTTRSPAMTSTG